MEIIEKFIEQYKREIDYYDKVSGYANQQIQQRLQESGIRAIVTSRAKNPERLKMKLEKRCIEKGYSKFGDIYEDIVDLAGVRIALYFPGESTEVDKIIRDQFKLLDAPKVFPEQKHNATGYKKRFLGYLATHYRVSIKPDSILEQHKRYCDAKIEIQVASVLMHAWSEVEHDLVYKPLQGDLSWTEYAILDELNGLVLSGELALERLQVAMEQRIKESGKEFSNNYELASYLFESAKGKLKNIEPMLGDVNVLFLLLEALEISSPAKISHYIETIDFESDKRTITQQIIDQIILGDSDKYKKYNDILVHLKSSNEQFIKDSQKAIGYFMTKWIELENMIREIIRERNNTLDYHRVMNSKELRNLNVLDQEELSQFDYLRRVRNNLVHGIEIPDADYITSAGKEIEKLINVIYNTFKQNSLHS